MISEKNSEKYFKMFSSNPQTLYRMFILYNLVSKEFLIKLFSKNL